MRRLLVVLLLLTSLRAENVATAQPAGAPATRQPAPAALPAPPAREPSIRLFESWKAPVPPRRLVGNIYYVGAIGVSSFLIATPQGHILLDTGFAETVPLIQRSVEQLGFKVADIKFILGSHAHIDHTGGNAAMKRLTGASIVSSAADSVVLASGGADDFSPFPKDLMRYEPIRADRVVHDGDVIELGGTRLQAHLTPGHTRGATTWSMKVRDGDREHDVVFFSSASIVEGTRLTTTPSYPGILDDYRATLAKLQALPCDIWFAPHGGQFAMADKLARLDAGATINPFIDPAGWKKLLEGLSASFARQLELEAAAR